MIHWVFLDVGNILLDEDPVGYHCTRLHWEAVRRVRPDVAFRELVAAREECALRGSRWPLYEAVSALIDEASCMEAWNVAEREIRARFDEYSPLIAGVRALVDRLAARFHLGIIANQGAECRARLDDLGLLPRFRVTALSEEVRLFKPDPRLYLHALNEAGAAPEQCVMIGDRLDNDVEPAGTLGMATLWVRWPERTRKGWHPADPNALAFRNSLQRTSARSLDRYQGLRPTLIVDHIDEIQPEAVAGL